ncbi:hypothetical protein GDO81_003088 [Engystomops pustulosus]|uniref:Uncharacterized protein n=1 Tax=Engystomops pustulosus TaxID=76066 RepID=A0AAV7A2J1_ENGPU|nr:hypothetical protein GDO81_003088 [Engystomops pustulosus]
MISCDVRPRSRVGAGSELLGLPLSLWKEQPVFYMSRFTGNTLCPDRPPLYTACERGLRMGTPPPAIQGIRVRLLLINLHFTPSFNTERCAQQFLMPS